MQRIWCLAILVTGVSFAQPATREPDFSAIPFDDWIKSRNDWKLHWTLLASQPNLDSMQRLQVSFTARVDVAGIRSEYSRGRFVILWQIRATDGFKYRKRSPVFLNERSNLAAIEQVKFGQSVCVNPGAYEIAAAVYDTATKRHNLKRIRLRVSGIPRDPFRDRWSSVPEIESVWECRPLSIPLMTKQPVRMEWIATRNTGGRLRVLSAMRPASGTMAATLIDMDHRVARTTEIDGNTNSLRSLWTGLPYTNRFTVDVKAMDRDRQNARFFVSEIEKRLNAPFTEPARWIVILSDPRNFPKGEDLSPIETPRPDRTRVIYIRTYSAQNALVADRLTKTLQPLHPRVIEVTTPLSFRHALGEIVKQVSQPAIEPAGPHRDH
jgi:hypothetical protein